MDIQQMLERLLAAQEKMMERQIGYLVSAMKADCDAHMQEFKAEMGARMDASQGRVKPQSTPFGLSGMVRSSTKSRMSSGARDP
jgi:hypothetical protein